jgi:hypothetical protein
MKNKAINFLCFITLFSSNLIFAQDNCSVIVGRKPQLSDSINPPTFLTFNNNTIEKVFESELEKIHKRFYSNKYMRVLFCITVDKDGNANELKLISVSKIFVNDFKKVYPNILKKLKTWNPATKKKTGESLPYILNIEIEFIKKDYKLVVYNNDIQKLLKASLTVSANR